MTPNLSFRNILRSFPGAGGRWVGLARAAAIGSVLGVLGLAASSAVVPSAAEAAEMSCVKQSGRNGNYLMCRPRDFPSPDLVAIKLSRKLEKLGAFPQQGQQLVIPMPRRIGAGIAPGDSCPGGGTPKCTAKCSLGPPPVCTYEEPCTCTLDKLTSVTSAFLVRNPDSSPGGSRPPRGPAQGTNILDGGARLPGATTTPGGGAAPPPPPGPTLR